MTKTMRLRKTDRVAIGRKGTTSMDYVSGMVDKTDTLSLVHRDNYWHVSIQRNGMRIAHYPLQSQARIYMEYMLEHAHSALTSIPINPIAANKEAYASDLKDVHFAARELALKGVSKVNRTKYHGG